jgi:hypothetical protein
LIDFIELGFDPNVDWAGAPVGDRYERTLMKIISTPAFDAVTLAPSTVCFGDVDESSQRDCSEEHGIGHIEDVNKDGRQDLLLHFAIAQSGIDSADGSACLTGQTFDGIQVQGCDVIKTQ